MKFKYVRIHGKNLAENTGYNKGIFSLCHQLVQDNVMEEEDKALFLEIDKWFSEILPYPPQCQRQEKVACWFKTDNSKQMLNLIQPCMWLLERYNVPYYLLYTNMPGEIVYEDEYQIVVKIEDDMLVDPVQETWTPDNLSEDNLNTN